VHGVVAAMRSRWSVEEGRTFRAPRLRGLVAPVMRPQIGLDRAIQAQQFRTGRFRRVIAVAKEVRDDLARVHGVPPELIDVVPPPIDYHRITQAQTSGLRAALGVPDGAPLVLFVGHDFQRKGLDRLIDAAGGVPETHVVVVGDGDRAAIYDSIGRDELARRVHFVGRVDDPERYYAEADLFVLPTRSDPWGIPLIEAMAAGVAVVSTSAAGAGSVVTKADAGIIVPVDSDIALREAIHALVRDPDRRRRMGERGRAMAVHFSAESHAAAVLETYRRAIFDAHPRRDGPLVS
jgi:UDP-glucose:(heptosyl)LPS alpha-1,3-glucosyltransferase